MRLHGRSTHLLIKILIFVFWERDRTGICPGSLSLSVVRWVFIVFYSALQIFHPSWSCISEHDTQTIRAITPSWSSSGWLNLPGLKVHYFYTDYSFIQFRMLLYSKFPLTNTITLSLLDMKKMEISRFVLSKTEAIKNWSILYEPIRVSVIYAEWPEICMFNY